MSGLGLTNALHEYQQGVAWSDQQKQQAVQNQQLQTIKDANAAGAAALQQAHEDDIAQQQKAWTDAGNDPATFQPKPFQMSPQVLLAGMHARSDAIAKSGDLDLWTRNEAATMPIRNTIRQQVISKALADYNATGDGAALAQTVYPTIHDGVNITGISSGVDASAAGQTAANGGQAPARVYKISTSDGQTHTLTGEQIASMAHDAMMDPNKVAEYEFQSRLQAAKTAQEMARDKAKASAEGDEARKTEGVKGDNAMKVEGLRSDTALKVGAGNNQATISAAGIRGDAETESAGISARGRVEAAGLRSSGGINGGKKVQKTLVDSDGYVVNQFKDGTMERAMVDGKPVRSGDYAKRVDAMARSLQQQPGNFKKSATELRALATQALSDGGGAPAPTPGLVPAPAPKPALPPMPGATPVPASGVSVSNW